MQVILQPDIFVTFLHSVTVHLGILYPGFYNILPSDPFTLRIFTITCSLEFS